MRIALALAFVLLNFYIYYYLGTDEIIPERETFAEFPLEIDEWRCSEPEAMDSEVLENLGATDYLICNYWEPDFESMANVYVGYHETQVRDEGGGAGENSIHPPEHCLPGSGWSVIDSQIVPIEFAGLPNGSGEAKRFVIAKGGLRQLVYFWYQSRGRAIARNHEVILYRFLDRALKSRTDGSLVRITVPIEQENEAEAESKLRQFAERFVPQLPSYVPN